MRFIFLRYLLSQPKAWVSAIGINLFVEVVKAIAKGEDISIALLVALLALIPLIFLDAHLSYLKVRIKWIAEDESRGPLMPKIWSYESIKEKGLHRRQWLFWKALWQYTWFFFVMWILSAEDWEAYGSRQIDSDDGTMSALDGLKRLYRYAFCLKRFY